MDCDEKLNTDERDGCRSLLCDTNGIIIAEMVYRCMRCSNVNDYMGEARKHYHDKHMENELNYNNNYLPIESKKNRDDSENWNCNGKLVSSSTPTESCTRSGYITCPVCSSTRFYTTLQRRYGQFTCVACYRFFKEFFINPTKYSCTNLGKCPLDVKSKCKACWINSCSKTYSVDERRKTILEANRPSMLSLRKKTKKHSNLMMKKTTVIVNRSPLVTVRSVFNVQIA
ncbi:nuclear receptor-like protein [Leptotrombidium deliense]|uniref:Nuclear receptor-like protein n=1 Tax=Leptotrombidium deliense TaxID=299467 RepID=A0A443SBQ8_9ACAR|nr:nuclear receptor-like protein [Leptotrombidium deliense]